MPHQPSGCYLGEPSWWGQASISGKESWVSPFLREAHAGHAKEDCTERYIHSIRTSTDLSISEHRGALCKFMSVRTWVRNVSAPLLLPLPRLGRKGAI